MHLKNIQIDLHLNESNKLINQQDFWLPCVFYTGEELRLGALS